jgi:hypothetical protein
LVFLRPTVIDNASLDGELEVFKKYLPDNKEPEMQSSSSSEES